MEDPLSSEQRSALMSRVRSKGGRSTEARLAGKLARCGIGGWKRNYEPLPGTPDFYFPAQEVAIFVDGCFWHGCPECNRNTPRTNRDFWKKKIARNRARDREVGQALEARGITVVRLWEHTLQEDDWWSEVKEIVSGSCPGLFE